MKGLTKRQSEIVHYVKDFIQTNRYSPSFREIMRHFGFSSLGTVHRHINVLKRKGIFLIEKNCGRSLALVSSNAGPCDKKEILLPFVGHLSVGKPIETFPQSRSIAVPEFMVHAQDKTYVLRMMGDSLKEDMIGDGDLLLVEARQEAHAGETVVALLHPQNTIVKKYFPEGQYIKLIGHNSRELPLLIRSDEIRIQGVLIGLLRLYG